MPQLFRHRAEASLLHAIIYGSPIDSGIMRLC